MLGPPPPGLLSRSRRAHDFFDSRRALRVERAADEPELVHYLPFSQLSPLIGHVLPDMPSAQRQALLVLLDGLLRWDPEHRWSGEQAHTKLNQLVLGAAPEEDGRRAHETRERC